MIKSLLNIYSKKTKGDKKTYTANQYIIRLKSKDISDEILNEIEDKEPVVVFFEHEYNCLKLERINLEVKVDELETQINEVKTKHENEISELSTKYKKEINDMSTKHQQEVNELNSKISTKDESIDTLRHNNDIMASNKRHLEVSLDKANQKINELEQELNKSWINRLFGRFKRNKDNELMEHSEIENDE